MADLDIDMTRTLEELERSNWGEPTFDSYLVTTCHALRRKPLADFGTEDLRIMIGQNIGVSFLLPLAVRVLQADPLASGDCYHGDLLVAVLACDLKKSPDWPKFVLSLEDIADRALKLLAREHGGIDGEILSNLRSGAQRLREIQKGSCLES